MHTHNAHHKQFASNHLVMRIKIRNQEELNFIAINIRHSVMFQSSEC